MCAARPNCCCSCHSTQRQDCGRIEQDWAVWWSTSNCSASLLLLSPSKDIKPMIFPSSFHLNEISSRFLADCWGTFVDYYCPSLPVSDTLSTIRNLEKASRVMDQLQFIVTAFLEEYIKTKHEKHHIFNITFFNFHLWKHGCFFFLKARFLSWREASKEWQTHRHCNRKPPGRQRRRFRYW